MTDVLIRRIEDRDIFDVADLWYQLSLHHEHFAKYYEVKSDSRELLIPHIKDLVLRNCIFFVAEKNEKVIGFVSGYVVSRNPQMVVERVGKVDNIFVNVDCRSVGVGTRLLETLFEYFHSQGAKYIELSCDYANDRAFKLYKKLGFKEQKVLMLKS